MHCNERNVGFLTVADNIYLQFKDLVIAMDLQKQYRKGYGFIDKPLQKLGFNPSSVFLYNSTQRQFIRGDCLVALIKDNTFKNAQTFGKELIALLCKEAAVSATVKTHIATPKRRVFETHLEVDSTKMTDKLKTKRTLFKRTSHKKKKAQSSKGHYLISTKTTSKETVLNFLIHFGKYLFRKTRQILMGAFP